MFRGPPTSTLFPYTTLFRSSGIPPRPHRGPHRAARSARRWRSDEHTSELQSQFHLVCRLLLEKKKNLTHHHASDRRNIIRLAHYITALPTKYRLPSPAWKKV